MVPRPGGERAMAPWGPSISPPQPRSGADVLGAVAERLLFRWRARGRISGAGAQRWTDRGAVDPQRRRKERRDGRSRGARGRAPTRVLLVSARGAVAGG